MEVRALVGGGNSAIYFVNLTSSPPSVITGTGYPVVVGSSPSGIAVTPDGSKAYVANSATGYVSVIDLTASPPVVATTITTSAANPKCVAISPDGNTAYVTQNDGVDVIDTSSDIITTSISGIQFSGSSGISITPDGSSVYVTNSAGNTVTYIDTATNTALGNISVGTQPTSLGQFIQPPSIPMTNIYTAPQGRLTLTSNAPVMTSDAAHRRMFITRPIRATLYPFMTGRTCNLMHSAS